MNTEPKYCIESKLTDDDNVTILASDTSWYSELEEFLVEVRKVDRGYHHPDIEFRFYNMSQELHWKDFTVENYIITGVAS